MIKISRQLRIKNFNLAIEFIQILSNWPLKQDENKIINIGGKMTKRPFSAKGVRATVPLELVHTDVYGSINL